MALRIAIGILFASVGDCLSATVIHSSVELALDPVRADSEEGWVYVDLDSGGDDFRIRIEFQMYTAGRVVLETFHASTSIRNFVATSTIQGITPLMSLELLEAGQAIGQSIEALPDARYTEHGELSIDPGFDPTNP